MSEKARTKTDEIRYTRDQLVKSGRWSADAVNAVLKDKEYTIAEADKAISDFYKRRVN